jgi:hypothetical protein
MNATSCATEGSDFHVYFKGVAGTSALTPGQYKLTVFATLVDDRYTVGQFPITIEADLSTGAPAQSHPQKMLTLLETAIYNRVNGNSDGGIESYVIDGTTVAKLSMEQLQKLRNKYAGEVAADQNRNSPIGRVKTVFTQAGTVPQLRRRFS